MRKTLAALVLAPAVLLAAPASAQSADLPSGVYKLDPTHASILWQLQHLRLSNFISRMEAFDIELTLDTDDLSKSTVRATVDASSVSTGALVDKNFDDQVANDARFLNSGQYPEITFVSTRVEPTGDETARVIGDLTLLGETREITLDVELVGAIAKHPLAQRAAVGFKATTTFDRTEFGMDFLAPIIVSPEVTVTINAEFVAE